jgi:N-glycosidase YbiA
MAILGFTGRYKFLSNFHSSKIKDEDGIIYATVEHAYQAAKTLNKTQSRRVRKAETPGESKRLGRKVTIRYDWEQIKDEMMMKFLRLKFSQHRDLRDALIKTGDEYLEETNNWGDTYWGVCKGVGKNILGKLLMEIRDKLK